MTKGAGVARLDASPRKAHLTGVIGELCRALREEHSEAVGPVDQRNENRGPRPCPRQHFAQLARQLGRLREAGDAGIRREPELPEHEEIVAPPPSPEQEFEFLDDEPDVDAAKARAMRQRMRMVARQVAMNPDDGIDL